MTAKSAKYKIAFTGTNSSGKTTTTLEVTSRLKSQHHYLAECVTSQDRKVTWKDEHFPVNPQAHYGMISGLIYAEVSASLKGDADVVVVDRSILDLYSIALTDHPKHSLITGMRGMIEEWMSTYTKVFYLPPLDYQEDGKRPPNEFRMRTHQTLLNLIPQFPGIEVVHDRTTLMGSVRAHLGIRKDTTPLAADFKWQRIANKLQVNLAVKYPKFSLSDTDVFIFTDDAGIYYEAQSLINLFFGNSASTLLQVPSIHLMGFPAGGEHHVMATAPGEYTLCVASDPGETVLVAEEKYWQ
jgi:hypothetical protein